MLAVVGDWIALLAAEEEPGHSQGPSWPAQLDQCAQQLPDVTYVHRLKVVERAMHHHDLRVGLEVAGQLISELSCAEGAVTCPVQRCESSAKVRDVALEAI